MNANGRAGSHRRKWSYRSKGRTRSNGTKPGSIGPIRYFSILQILPLLLVATQSVRLVRTSADHSRVIPADKQISVIVGQINPTNIEATIRKLVSFGTRNTLSTQDDPNRGIGAARDWLFAEFSKLKGQSEGRLTVELQS